MYFWKSGPIAFIYNWNDIYKTYTWNMKFDDVTITNEHFRYKIDFWDDGCNYSKLCWNIFSMWHLKIVPNHESYLLLFSTTVSNNSYMPLGTLLQTLFLEPLVHPLFCNVCINSKIHILVKFCLGVKYNENNNNFKILYILLQFRDNYILK